jgi:uncharacterized membrane protein YeaQ/YmgE (transglycosylase-associated protein family)
VSILAWIALGLIAGLLDRALARQGRPLGCILAVLAGVAGALLGGALATGLGFGGLLGGLDLRSLAVAALGAVVLLVALRLLRGRDVR